MRAAVSQSGETLDALLWRVIGATAALATVYAANPGLAALGPILPAGTEVTIPTAAEASPAPLREDVKLWS